MCAAFVANMLIYWSMCIVRQMRILGGIAPCRPGDANKFKMLWKWRGWNRATSRGAMGADHNSPAKLLFGEAQERLSSREPHFNPHPDGEKEIQLWRGMAIGPHGQFTGRTKMRHSFCWDQVAALVCSDVNACVPRTVLEKDVQSSW